MVIRIGKYGQVMSDYTDFLVETDDIVLIQERERGLFERVVSEAHLKLENFNGTFSSLFGNQLATERFEVELSEEARILFVGEIKMSSIAFDSVSETVSFDVFSLDKRFWDATKQHRVKEFVFPNSSSDSVFDPVYVQFQIFIREMLKRTGIDTLFSGYNIASEYASRPIRGYQLLALPNWELIPNQNIADFVPEFTSSNASIIISQIANDGRLKELNPESTIFEVISACAKYYNAEIFVDPQNRNLTIKRRTSIYNDVQTDIKDLYNDDQAITITPNQTDKYDYIQVGLQMPKPSAPDVTALRPVTYSGGAYGDTQWAVSFLFQFGNYVLETFIGNEYSLNVPLLILTSSNKITMAEVDMNIPVGPTGCIGRKIYRNGYPVGGKYFLVGQVNDNTTTTFTDSYHYDGNTVFSYLTVENFDGTYWFGFDEATNKWLEPIQNDGSNNVPEGKIFDARPQLSFVNRNARTQVLDYNILDVIHFFGGYADFNLSTLADQWKDIFTKSQKVVLSVNGLSYVVGDSVLHNGVVKDSSLLISNRLRIVKATQYLIKERTELELATV